MIQVAICDDNEIFLNQVFNATTHFFTTQQLSVNISAYKNGADLSHHYEQAPMKYDLLLLDIIMPDVNGIDLAKKIRQSDPHVTIIFISSSKEYAVESYDVNATHYLLKPLHRPQLELILQRFVQTYHQQKQRLIPIKYNQDILSLNLNDTLYFESYLRKITAYTTLSTISFYGKLSEIEEQVHQQNYIRIHQSYLINLSYVKSILGNTVLLTNETVLPISKKHLPKFKETFVRYLQQQLG